MDPKDFLNWKAAAGLASATAALSIGIAYLAGSPGQDARQGRPDAGFRFETSPVQAPGAAVPAPSSQPRSYLDMFREANKDYSRETAAPAAADAHKKPRSKKEMDELLGRVHNDIAAPQTAAGLPAAAEGYGGAPRRAYGAAAETGQTGQQGAQAEAALPRLQSQQAAGKAHGRGSSAFAAGFNTEARRGGSLNPQRAAGISQGSDSDSSAGFQGGGGGNSMYAGEYGSHGGGQSSAQGGSSSADSSGSGMAAAAKAEKEKPAPLTYIWPRYFDYGAMDVNEGAERQVIIMNMGSAGLKLGRIENVDDESPFTLQQDKCSSATLAPRKSCTFRIRFAPGAAGNYHSAIYVPSDSETDTEYSYYIEVKGSARSARPGWLARGRWGGGENGRVNTLDFGMVPAGYPVEQPMRVVNTSGEAWENVRLDMSALPASFSLASDGCTGRDIGPGGYCVVRLKLAPTDEVNRRFSGSYYGQYSARDMMANKDVISPRPHFPPLTLTAPVEASPHGELRVLADYAPLLHRRRLVLSAPVKAASCAEFPVYGLARVMNYYYFK